MIFHISRFRRDGKTGLHLGGVEKFAYYLQLALGDNIVLMEWDDYPRSEWEMNIPDYEKAKLLSEWALSNNIIGKSDIVIADGYWASGFEGKVERLISVCHGSYLGRMVASLNYPWGEIVPWKEVQAQKEIWENESVEVVAVSLAARREISWMINKDCQTIPHGIPLDIYKPMDIKKVCLMHAATSTRKGSDVISILAKEGIEIIFMNESSGILDREARRLNEASALIAPTRHEGNSYLLLEAIACGVPVLTYSTGTALEIDGRCGIVTSDLSWPNFKMIIDGTDWRKFSPRKYAEEYLSFDLFANRWKYYLEVQ